MALTKTPIAMLDATGTAGSGNFLRGDGTWSTPASGITAMTVVASTSGTSIDFTSIPAGVKRITVMFSGFSTNGTSNYLIQLGSGSVTTSGYVSTSTYAQSGAAIGGTTSTAGIVITNGNPANIVTGNLIINLLTGNQWVGSGVFGQENGTVCVFTGGRITLSGTLDRVRLTTVNGTDTFDAGSINVFYE